MLALWKVNASQCWDQRRDINSGSPKENSIVQAVLSSDVAGLLMDTDADTNTETVNRLQTFELR